MKNEIIAGVYIIKNELNGKVYIGSTVNIYSRWYDHMKFLKKNEHHSIKLQRAWNKYGKAAFKFEILEQVIDGNVTCEHLIYLEQFYLDTIIFANEKNDKFNKLGYNVLRIAGSSLGIKQSKETREKRRKSMKKVWKDNNYRELMAVSFKGNNSGNIRNDLKEYNINKKSKKVYQYSLNGEFIKKWNSVSDVHRELKFHKSNIARACNSKTKKSHGFIWKYIKK